jgi:FkbM family methyltransferase
MNTAIKLASRLYGSGIGRLPLVYRTYQKLMPLLMRDRRVIIQLDGFKIEIDTSRYINSNATQLLFGKVHEPITSEIFRLLLSKGDKVIDVGANIGYFTMLAASLVGTEGRVFAFEPGDIAYADLRNNVYVNSFDNIVAYNRAASDYCGERSFYLAKENTTNSLIRDAHLHKQSTIVEVDRIDRLINEQVNLIKIDTEGNELEVLKGARNLINKCPDLCVILEIGEKLKYQHDLLVETWIYLQSMKFDTMFMINEFNGTIQLVESVYDIQCDHDNMYLNLLCFKGGIKWARYLI